jgi:hypothetical protein
MGTGMAAEGQAYVYALLPFGGQCVYAGGTFTSAGGVAANHAACWDGSAWSTAGVGMDDGPVRSLAFLDAGSGPAMYAAGTFVSSAGSDLNGIARWTGAAWEPLGSGVDDCAGACALAAYNDGAGPAIFAGGDFSLIGGGVSSGLGRFGCEEAAVEVAASKRAGDTRLASVGSVVSTAVFGDEFYVEQPDRASGIRVIKPGHGVVPGQSVAVTGRMRTNAQRERYIEASSVGVAEPRAVEPLCVTNAALGGGACGLQSACWGWRWEPDGNDGMRRVRGEMTGMSNVGLLVRTTGRVKSTTTGSFTIDDGSDTQVKCVLPRGMVADPTWDYVTVTGISSCEIVGSELRAVILVRSAGDVLGIM